MHYIIHYDVAALIIMVVLFIHFYSNQRIKLGATRVFVALMLMSLCSDALDLISVYTIGYPQSVPLWLNDVINMAYLTSFQTVPMIYFVYLREIAKSSEKWTKKELALALLPFTVEILLILTSVFTGWVFYFEDGVTYQHGPMMVLLYVGAVYYMVTVLVYTVRYRLKLTRSQIVVVLFYTVANLTCIVLQMFIPDILILQFAVALAVLLIYLSLENPEEFTDRQVGLFNRRAFFETISHYLRNDEEFEIMGIRVGGTGYLMNVIGQSGVNDLMRMVAEFLESISGRKRKVFYIDQNRFMVLAEGSTSNWDIFEEVLWKRFSQSFTFENMDVTLDLTITLLTNKEHQGLGTDDVIRVMERSLLEAEKSGAKSLVIDGEQMLEKGRREGEILHILKEAVRNGKFEVFYQPIYSVEKKCYTCAEALIRLKDDRMGYISPEEFVPIAERHGLILEMGEFVFRDVCRFFAQERLWEKGIEYIDVNLSVVQCMQDDLHERFLAIMDEYRLPYHCINLEITETAAVLSTESLRNNMNCFMEKGVNFSLDDYGTGFSNTASIIEYPFHTIKLDKSMLWSSEESSKAMCALEHMIAMIKAMQMELICEGVETFAQATMLERMGCDYFQGYYFSKPVDGATFLDVLARDRAQNLLRED